jgi:ATP-dependent protease Clp ATPase subunit
MRSSNKQIPNFSKIAKKSDMMNPNQKDVSGEGVQQGK